MRRSCRSESTSAVARSGPVARPMRAFPPPRGRADSERTGGGARSFPGIRRPEANRLPEAGRRDANAGGRARISQSLRLLCRARSRGRGGMVGRAASDEFAWITGQRSVENRRPLVRELGARRPAHRLPQRVAMKPTNRIPTHPGEILREELLVPLGQSRVALAGHLGVPVQRINELVRGKRGVTPETAWLLAQAFDTTPQPWLYLQSAYGFARSRPRSEVPKLRRAS